MAGLLGVGGKVGVGSGGGVAVTIGDWVAVKTGAGVKAGISVIRLLIGVKIKKVAGGEGITPSWAAGKAVSECSLKVISLNSANLRQTIIIKIGNNPRQVENTHRKICQPDCLSL